MSSDTQFSLRWNNYGSTFTSAINSLYQINDFVDVTLVVEEEQLKAHKMILSACSAYFHNILKNNPCQHPIIILKEVAAEDLRSVLSFIYKGEVSITQPRLHSFMRLAELLRIKGLTEPPLSEYNSDSITGICDFLSDKERVDSPVSLDLSKKRKKSKMSSEVSPTPGDATNRNTSPVPCLIGEKTSEDFSIPQIIVKKKRISHDQIQRTSSPSRSSSSPLENAKKPSNSPCDIKTEPEDVDEGSPNTPSTEDAEIQSRQSTSCDPSPELNDEDICLPVDNSPSPDTTIPTCPNSCTTEKQHPKTDSLLTSKEQNLQPDFTLDQSYNSPLLPYPCPFCEKTYTSWGFRRRHIKGYHTETSELPCRWCSAVFPSTEEWQNHMTELHSLSLTDAHNGILILEEAHMVLQVSQPTRLSSIMEMIKKKKLKDTDDLPPDKEKTTNVPLNESSSKNPVCKKNVD